MRTFFLFLTCAAAQDPTLLERMERDRASSGSFMTAYFKNFAQRTWESIKTTLDQQMPVDAEPIWQQPQCLAPPGKEMKICSCFEMFNMADRFLENGATVSTEEYKQLRRRAAKMHHRDKQGGSDARMIFLNRCSELLCGDEKCKQPNRMSRNARQRKKSYIEELRMIRRESESESDAQEAQETYVRAIRMLNARTFSTHEPAPEVGNQRKPQGGNGDSGILEELVVLLDDTYSLQMKEHGDTTNLVKAKQIFGRIFPRFEKTPTSVHLVRGSEASVSSGAFKEYRERVEAAGGVYANTAVRATLIWDDCNDLDLHVIEPSGNKIYFIKRKSSTGGELDVDRNSGRCRDHSPVENIRWLSDHTPLPKGKYTVEVEYWANHDSNRGSNFRVQVAVGDRQVYEGQHHISSGKQKIFTVELIEQPGTAPSVSREIVSPENEFTREDVYAQWGGTSLTTHLWEYAFEVLKRYQSRPDTRVEALIITDGKDNDSPYGFVQMMNMLHRMGVRPRFSVYCIGNDECTGQTEMEYRDLVLSSGGAFAVMPSNAGVETERKLIADFANNFTASYDKRLKLAGEAQQQWLGLIESGAEVTNKDAEYTRELQLHLARDNVASMDHSSEATADTECRVVNRVQQCTVN